MGDGVPQEISAKYTPRIGSANLSRHPPSPTNRNDLPTSPASASVPNDLRIKMHDKTGKVVLCQPLGPITVAGRSVSFFFAIMYRWRPRTSCCGDARASVVLAAYSLLPPKLETHPPQPIHAMSCTPDLPSVEPKYETNPPKSRPIMRDHHLI